MAIITISRQYGSGGDEIADRVCEILGYHHFGRREIAQAAVEAGFSDKEIANYSEYSDQNYKYKTFVDHLLRQFGSSKSSHAEPISVRELAFQEQLFDSASFLGIVQKAIRAAYHAGNFLILGRAANVVLKNYPGVLSLRIEAPLEYRIERVKQSLKEEQHSYYPTLEARRTAQELIAERDAASSDYVRHFYGVEWSDPFFYHAVLNASKFQIEQAANVIVQMLNCLESKNEH